MGGRARRLRDARKSALLTPLAARAGAETAFNKPRVAIPRAGEGEQVPSVSSSLLEDIRIGG